MTDDLTEIAAELYALVPGEFVRARDARVKALRADGERDLAGTVKALRRPTVAAWLVNLLAVEQGALDELLDLGRQLRDAQSRLDAPAMKDLAAQRPALVRAAVTEASRLARGADADYSDTPATLDQVSATLTAALADPHAELAVSSGRLVTALAYAGFGEVEIGDAVATPLRVVPPPIPTDVEPESTDDSDSEVSRVHRPDVGGASQARQDHDASLVTARAKVDRAAAALEVAEASLAQARSRRAAARRTLEAATAALEDLALE